MTINGSGDLDRVIAERVRARRGHRIWTTVREGLVIITVIIVVWVLVTVRLNQTSLQAKVDQTHSAAKNSEQILHVLHDCLTRGGTCYARSQADQRAVLGQVQQLLVYVELCGRRPSIDHSLPALEACVESLIKEHGLK